MFHKGRICEAVTHSEMAWSQHTLIQNMEGHFHKPDTD